MEEWKGERFIAAQLPLRVHCIFESFMLRKNENKEDVSNVATVSGSFFELPDFSGVGPRHQKFTSKYLHKTTNLTLCLQPAAKNARV